MDWCRKNVGDALTFKIYCPSKHTVVSQLLGCTADPERGAIINKQIHPDRKLDSSVTIDSNSGGVQGSEQ